MNKITIAIPNFNGKDLLQNNLPNVLDSGVDEVLVIDDGSSDDSVKYLEENFPQVKLIRNYQNMGFIFSVNKLFEHAVGKIVVLLNSDILVEKNFIKPLISHFDSDKVFAVNCHEKGEGWSKARWQDGFFEFDRGEEGTRVHKSSWASGGSAAYRKSLWQKLGGFDSLYAPFYWEDIDLSYRAIKAGYDVLWEPKALVYHNHETTIKKSFKKGYVDWVKQRNQLLFIWKNISDADLLKQHKLELIKRLSGGMGVGYWIPFLWALLKITSIKKQKSFALSDKEVIDYVNQ